VKLAADSFMLRPRSIPEVFEVVRDAGYRYLEWAPREDFLPGYAGRRASPEAVRAVCDASRTTGVEVASLFVEYASASSDESVRAASVRYWKQAIEIAGEVGCDRINGELTGHPAHPQEGEAALLRTLDEILPVAERAGVTIALEAHTGDFIEYGVAAADLIRGIRSDHLRYVHCVPHAFYLGLDPRTAAGLVGRPFMSNGELIRYAGPVLDHIHLADTFRPERVFLNPPAPGSRIHSHNDIGVGEIDWPDVFQGIKDVGFDGVLTVTVFRQEQRAAESLRSNRERVEGYLR
jgi:myo-inositol catabolism protein IolH